MAAKKLTRGYWLSELKRATLEKQNFIEKVYAENFAGIDPYDVERKIAALQFCEDQYKHFIAAFETWINDNYPADVKPGQLFGDIQANLESLKTFRKVFGQ